MLDTNAISELMRQPGGAFAQWSANIPAEQLFTSVVVACELRFGAKRKGSAALSRAVELMLGNLLVLPFGPPADAHHADIRATLEKAGRPIGSHDLFIAAHARSLKLTLVTRNMGEFSRVPRLRCLDWSTLSA
jgi:tRNA(fMet)-specific endonuclease VapC